MPYGHITAEKNEVFNHVTPSIHESYQIGDRLSSLVSYDFAISREYQNLRHQLYLHDSMFQFYFPEESNSDQKRLSNILPKINITKFNLFFFFSGQIFLFLNILLCIHGSVLQILVLDFSIAQINENFGLIKVCILHLDMNCITLIRLCHVCKIFGIFVLIYRSFSLIYIYCAPTK